MYISEPLSREHLLAKLRGSEEWDIIIIGGGATGLGAALDAASRGLRTLLLEAQDFAQGTSSRSTKLIHGGVRYLSQMNLSLVREALQERSTMMRIAAHTVVNPLGFVIPLYRWVDIPIYAAGLKLYDALARDSNLPTSRILSRAEVCHLAPGIASHDIVGRSLKGGIQYFDGQFDDARFAISLMQSAFSQGATLLNYVPCTGFLKTDGNISGVLAKDAETGEDFQIRGRMVVNATGVFVDALRSMDNPGQAPVVSPSQGVHIVVDRKFMPGDQAILIPKTPDGRVLFCIPWLGKILIGTTDTPRNETRFDPEPLEAEIDYLLSTAGQALAAKPVRADIRARFAGLRPLISSGAAIPTSQLSREHIILVSPSRLITITGGKWTTYRKMAEEVIDASLRVAGLRHIPSKTATLPLAMPTYAPDYGEPLHPDFPYDTSVVSNAFRYELARQPDDILFRRTRIGFLDECAANAVRPRVESLLAAARTASAEVTPAIQKQARE